MAARPYAEAALAAARVTGFLPAIVEAEPELGMVLHGIHDEHAAERTLGEALLVAVQVHVDYRAARISALLVEVAGVTGGVVAADRQGIVARSTIVRIGGDRHLEATIEHELGRANADAATYGPVYVLFVQAAVSMSSSAAACVDSPARRGRPLPSIDRIDVATRAKQRLIASDREHLGPKQPRTSRLRRLATACSRPQVAESAVVLARHSRSSGVNGPDSSHSRRCAVARPTDIALASSPPRSTSCAIASVSSRPPGSRASPSCAASA